MKHTYAAFSQLTCLLTISLMGFAAPVVAQGPAPLNETTVEPYFLFPATSSAALVSFDWDASGNLHYTVGDPNWGLKLEVYKVGETGAEQIFASNEVWAGSRIACIGDRVYFNDGGDFVRFDFNYYAYEADVPGSVSPLLTAPYGASLWGLTARHAGEFVASGSEATWGPAALFYSPLDASGFLASVPPVLFGEVGDSPGPIVFDSSGALYYVPGYAFSGTAVIYRWRGPEVEAALADPEGAKLLPDGHAWATLPAPYDGATGMAADVYGNIFVTATSWGSPSQLLLFSGDDGAVMSIAEYSGRLETLRYRNNAVHVSCADGVFRLPSLAVEAALESLNVQAVPGETAVLAVEARGGFGQKQYQWYRLDSQKSSMPVGNNLSHFSFTVIAADSGAEFYCVASDAVSSVESPHFTLTVQMPTPVAGVIGLVLSMAAVALCGLWTIRETYRMRAG